MKRFVVRLGIVSVALALSALAQAGPDDEHGDRGRPESSRRDAPAARAEGRGPADHGQAERGAGPEHSFRRGDRLPQNYRGRDYVENDWRGHHLSAPPRGYHWVRAGDDYVLAAITTGIILQLMLAH